MKNGGLTALKCASCGDNINDKPIKQGKDLFCSLECANKASGIAPEENDDYFEEGALEGFNEDDE